MDDLPPPPEDDLPPPTVEEDAMLGEVWPFTDLLGELIRGLEEAYRAEHPDGDDEGEGGLSGKEGSLALGGRGITYPGKVLMRTPSATSIPTARRRSLDRRKKRLSAPSFNPVLLHGKYIVVFCEDNEC